MAEGNPSSELATVGAKADFTLTRWSLVLRAGANPGSSDNVAALEWLCQRYWYPLYVLARRYGRNPDAAKDSTQQLFLSLIAQAKLAQAGPERGRFRNWWRRCFENHLKPEDARARIAKRGGRQAHLPMEAQRCERGWRHGIQPHYAERPTRGERRL